MRSPWQYSFYWSSSPYAYDSGYAWGVYFVKDDVLQSFKSNNVRVRLARSGQ